MTTSTTSTYILDPFQRLIPHTTSSFKTKIRGLGGIRSVYTLTSSTTYSTSTVIVGATKPLSYTLRVLAGSATYEPDGLADFSDPGKSNFYWNIYSGQNDIIQSPSYFYARPQPITPIADGTYPWIDMLGTYQDPLYGMISNNWNTYKSLIYGLENITLNDYLKTQGQLYKMRYRFDNQIIEDTLLGESVYRLFSQTFPTWDGGGGKYQFLATNTTTNTILNGSGHVVIAELIKSYYPGRRAWTNPSGVYYPEIPPQSEQSIASVSQSISYRGSKVLVSTHNTGTVSSNTGNSTATSVELLYYVNNEKMSESIDIFSSFSTGTSWANLWNLPNKFRSKNTSTGNLQVTADLKFNNQSIQMIQGSWPICSTGSKLTGKCYNVTDMNVAAASDAGKLFVLTSSTNTTTSGLSTINFSRNSTNTVSISIVFTDDTGTVYTTSSSIIARWV